MQLDTHSIAARHGASAADVVDANKSSKTIRADSYDRKPRLTAPMSIEYRSRMLILSCCVCAASTIPHSTETPASHESTLQSPVELPSKGNDSLGHEDAPRPNFLLVVTDDQRFDQLGAAGHPVLETPTMDALAERGVRFTEAFVTTPICAASRASILTGRREGRHGYTFGTAPMGEALAEDSYPARLRAAGYHTGFVGKWGVRFEQGLRDRMFDEFASMSLPYRRDGAPHLTDRIGQRAVEFLEGAPTDEPFCLSVSFWAPHAQDGHPDQYLPPEQFSDLYGDAEVPKPPLAIRGFEVLPEFLKDSLGRKRWHWRFDTREKQIQRTRDYWRMITGADRALSRILEAIEKRGALENTIVIFTSDNGYFLGERGLAGKWFNYDESIRVPLIIVDPRVKSERRGQTSSAMALNIDIAPTLLSLAGLTIPEHCAGQSLMPWVRGSDAVLRDDFLVEHRFDHPEIPASVGVRAKRWVYTRYDGVDPQFEQLFDLHADPTQLNDLARDPAWGEVLDERRARCDKLLQID